MKCLKIHRDRLPQVYSREQKTIAAEAAKRNFSVRII